MTMIVVGVSHRSAPFELLDRVATDEAGSQHMLSEALASEYVAEVMVLSTCNRVEIYADVDRFHGAVQDLGSVLAKHAGIPVSDLAGHLYVHYDARAVHHLFSVACGLDSMVVGEQQILGQVREALRSSQEAAAAGREINAAAQSALRVGKRVHAETEIDHHGASLVTLGLDAAREVLGPLDGRTAVVVGAGAMSSLAVKHLTEAGVSTLTVVNRTPRNAQKMAASDGGTQVVVAGLDELSARASEADVIIACTGAAGTVLGPEHLGAPRSRVVIDLALPRDVDQEVAALPQTHLFDLAALATRAPRQSAAADEATRLVAGEAREFTASRTSLSVEPIVVSLRAKADGLVEREMQRLRLRLPHLDDVTAGEVEHAVRRALAGLLHAPTVRIKEMASLPDGEQLAATVRAIFDLDPDAVKAITGEEVDG